MNGMSTPEVSANPVNVPVKYKATFYIMNDTLSIDLIAPVKQNLLTIIAQMMQELNRRQRQYILELPNKPVRIKEYHESAHSTRKTINYWLDMDTRYGVLVISLDKPILFKQEKIAA